MKTLFGLLSLSIIFIISSCSTQINSQSDEIPTPLVEIQYQNNTTIPDNVESTDNIIWISAFTKEADLDDDNNSEFIEIQTSGEDVAHFTVKVSINNNDKIYIFDKKYNLLEFTHCDLICVGQNNNALLLVLSSDSESPVAVENTSPFWWFDRNFIVIGYQNNQIVTLLDGINTLYNTPDVFKLKYLGDYFVQIDDTFSSLSAQIRVVSDIEIYKELEDEIKTQFKTGNLERDSGVSVNYIDIGFTHTDDENADILLCSKYIPGICYRRELGTIEYQYEFKENRYVLTRETLKYKDEGSIDKTMEIKFE